MQVVDKFFFFGLNFLDFGLRFLGIKYSPGGCEYPIIEGICFCKGDGDKTTTIHSFHHKCISRDCSEK